MGTLVGHILPGFFFFALGLWHLFNHIKLFSLHSKSYIAPLWFPLSKPRYLEPILIIIGSSLSISVELFLGQKIHQPFDPNDGTIPSNHLHNFEHSCISFTFITYAAFAIVFDKTRPMAHRALINLIAALAFAQQLFLFHFHSSDHTGVEGHYHLLLQLVVFVSLVTTLLGIALPSSFVLSFVRSLSVSFQGLWLMSMACMLWTPSLVPKDCFLHIEEGKHTIRCSSVKALHRAISLVNIQFSWFLVIITIFAMWFYIILQRIYGEKIEYSQLRTKEYSKNMEIMMTMAEV
ncbi:hypothetical protein ISN45_Aa06g019740 [Arabidopsis thaliana x Arabidopsis arenosa]|uniref:Transmembrane protein 45B-like n=1 Tax=Arabidopsis thaliana x Arabidopsis arenosa TaxID=1240361 RepID=A0A8T1Z006_9BRAS|nr:hypothetical protein ISN45_Aa06g019740 [Arabidopsis thaliana x Arabidopsis arenosa]